MTQTTKTSTNAGKGTTKTLKPGSNNESGIDEPYLNPSLAGATFRHEGKMYRYDEHEQIVRFYPPNEKQSKRNVKSLKSGLDDELGIDEPYLNPDPTTVFVRFEGRYYKFDADGNPYRFYPPGLRKPRKKVETTP